MILGYDNELTYTYNSTVTESIIIGNNNVISNEAANIFVIGKNNYIQGKSSIVSGESNWTFNGHCLVAGTYNNAYALGQTIFGSHHNDNRKEASTAMKNAEYSFISGVSNFANGKAASVLGDNLQGSEETGSLTIGTFNEKKDAMFVVGNGNQSSSDEITRSNAFEVYKNGDATVQNNLTVGGTIMMDADYTPSSDRHIITMKYLNTRIQELLDNEISSKITEELNKINNAEDNTY